MRIGIVVDGIGERSALPKLNAQIRTPHVLLDPVKRDIQPLAPLGQIVRAAVKGCRVLAVKRIDLTVVLFDLEQRDECPGRLAHQLQSRIQERVAELGIQVAVVVKVRTFENWLVSDLECLSRLSGHFPECQRVRQAASTGAADQVDALAILQEASGRRRSYHKVHGAVAICSRMDLERAASNSRSLRRFLRVLGDERYTDQSRRPAASREAQA